MRLCRFNIDRVLILIQYYSDTTQVTTTTTTDYDTDTTTDLKNMILILLLIMILILQLMILYPSMTMALMILQLMMLYPSTTLASAIVLRMIVTWITGEALRIQIKFILKRQQDNLPASWTWHGNLFIAENSDSSQPALAKKNTNNTNYLIINFYVLAVCSAQSSYCYLIIQQDNPSQNAEA